MSTQHGIPGEWARVRGTVLSLWPLFIAFMCLGAFATALIIGRHAIVFAVLFFVSIVAVAAMWRRGVRRVASFFVGARGEERVANVLAELPASYHVFHDFMAAGGPVLSPDNQCFVVTPICPHSLVNRSIVFSSDKELLLTVGSDMNHNVYLSIDGESSIPIDSDTRIIVSKSEYSAKLIKLKPENFYEILNKKIIERRN